MICLTIYNFQVIHEQGHGGHGGGHGGHGGHGGGGHGTPTIVKVS